MMNCKCEKSRNKNRQNLLCALFFSWLLKSSPCRRPKFSHDLKSGDFFQLKTGPSSFSCENRWVHWEFPGPGPLRLPAHSEKSFPKLCGLGGIWCLVDPWDVAENPRLPAHLLSKPRLHDFLQHLQRSAALGVALETKEDFSPVFLVKVCIDVFCG